MFRCILNNTTQITDHLSLPIQINNLHIIFIITAAMEQNPSPQSSSLKQSNTHEQMFLPDIGNDDDVPFYGSFLQCLGNNCGCMRTWCPCICCCFVSYPYITLQQGNQGIFSKFGRYKQTVLPGLHYVNPCTQNLTAIDVRINVMDLDRQNVITKDNVRINIDCSVYYRVVNSRFAHYRVENFRTAIEQNTCGQFILQDLLEKRAEIANDIEKQVDDYTRHWGVDVVDIFIKDIQLNPELQNLLSSAAKQRRLAESKMIIAKAEVESAKLMRTAAECLNSPAAIQMRYLETMKQMGTGINKLVFVPKEGLKQKVQHMITQGLIL